MVGELSVEELQRGALLWQAYQAAIKEPYQLPAEWWESIHYVEGETFHQGHPAYRK